MITSLDIRNAEELAALLEGLSGEADRLRAAGSLNVPEIQRLTHALTRARLVLNELERLDGRRLEGSAEPAAFNGLETRIRAMQEQLYADLRR